MKTGPSCEAELLVLGRTTLKNAHPGGSCKELMGKDADGGTEERRQRQGVSLQACSEAHPCCDGHMFCETKLSICFEAPIAITN